MPARPTARPVHAPTCAPTSLPCAHPRICIVVSANLPRSRENPVDQQSYAMLCKRQVHADDWTAAQRLTGPVFLTISIFKRLVTSSMLREQSKDGSQSKYDEKVGCPVTVPDLSCCHILSRLGPFAPVSVSEHFRACIFVNDRHLACRTHRSAGQVCGRWESTPTPSAADQL